MIKKVKASLHEKLILIFLILLGVFALSFTILIKNKCLFVKNFDPQKILTESQKVGVPILGIRAVQAGALTLEMDREPHPSGFDIKDFEDYDKAEPFRKLASEWKMNPSILAHRYALSAEKVSSVILGVKNRAELLDCIEAESLGELNQDQISTIDIALSR